MESRIDRLCHTGQGRGATEEHSASHAQLRWGLAGALWNKYSPEAVLPKQGKTCLGGSTPGYASNSFWCTDSICRPRSEGKSRLMLAACSCCSSQAGGHVQLPPCNPRLEALAQIFCIALQDLFVPQQVIPAPHPVAPHHLHPCNEIVRSIHTRRTAAVHVGGAAAWQGGMPADWAGKQP